MARRSSTIGTFNLDAAFDKKIRDVLSGKRVILRFMAVPKRRHAFRSSVEDGGDRNAVVPRRAELILCFLLPPATRANMLGDLEEEFRTRMLPIFGVRVARCWYWTQAVRSVIVVLWSTIIRVVAVGAGSKVLDWFTRMSGN